MIVVFIHTAQHGSLKIMDKLINKLNRMKQEIEEKEQEKNRIEGALKSIFDELEEKYDIINEDELAELIDKKENELNKLEDEFKKEMEKLEDDYKWESI